MITWKELLEELRRCDGQITDYGHPVGQLLFIPAIGNSRTGERVEWETFSMLRDEGWITTEDQGGIKRYRISEAGAFQLTDTESLLKARAGSAGSL